MAGTMQKNQSITELLAAEKVAAGKIDEARKRKAKRFKDAQNEAKAEIEELRNQHETKLRSLEKEMMGDRTAMKEASERKTHDEIEALKEQYGINKDKLLQRILDLVNDIDPKAHINARE